MKKFKYEEVDRDEIISMKQLKELGLDGWQLVIRESYYDNSKTRFRYIFMREIAEKPIEEDFYPKEYEL